MNDLESLVTNQFEAGLETLQASLGHLPAQIARTGILLAEALRGGGKLLAFGNGGSAAQADHLAAELIGRYRRTRRALAAISLPASAGSTTCIANDFSYDEIFERQVRALAAKGDIVVGLSTSGKSRNVLRGLQAGRDAGATSILLTGMGIQDAPADHIISVPSASTARIQEIHLLTIHAWCEIVDGREA